MKKIMRFLKVFIYFSNLHPRYSLVLPLKNFNTKNTRHLTWETHVCHNIAFPGLDGGHLLKEVFTSNEADGGQECNNRNSNPIVTGIAISIVEAHFLVLVPNPALWRDATKDNDGKELKEEISYKRSCKRRIYKCNIKREKFMTC